MDGKPIGRFAALTGRIEEWQAAIARQRGAESIMPESDLTDASLFVEGVAMVRLATQLSIAIRREYPFVPDVAISPSLADSFPTHFKVWDTI